MDIRAAITKYHRLGTTDWWLKQQKLIFSQFWKPEVQDQGNSKVVFS